MTDMQVTVGLGRKARHDRVMNAVSKVAANDLADEIVLFGALGFGRICQTGVPGSDGRTVPDLRTATDNDWRAIGDSNPGPGD